MATGKSVVNIFGIGVNNEGLTLHISLKLIEMRNYQRRFYKSRNNDRNVCKKNTSTQILLRVIGPDVFLHQDNNSTNNNKIIAPNYSVSQQYSIKLTQPNK